MHDLAGLLKQAQQFQSRMAELQKEIEEIEVEGSSGAGLVSVTATAKGAVKRLHIDPSLIKPDDAEVLEDLIVAALNDARAKGEAAIASRMQSLTGGLPLPPGFKLPF